MPRFRVIIIATGLNVPPDGAVGFTTTRFVHASSEHEAERVAVQLVEDTVASEPAFAQSSNRQLRVHLSEHVKNPFRRSRPNAGFTFIADDGAVNQALEIEEAAGAGWFR